MYRRFYRGVCPDWSVLRRYYNIRCVVVGVDTEEGD